MVKILISGTHSSLHNGTMAMVLATINTLRKLVSYQIEVTIISDTPQIDYARYSGLDIQVIGTPWRLRHSSRILTLLASLLRLFFILFSHLLLAFLRLPTRHISSYNLLLKFDMVIDLGGDNLSETYGLAPLYDNAFPLFLSLLLKKPFIIYAQSIGPFKSWITRRLMKFIFDRASLITVREEISKKYLYKIKVKNKNIFLTADSAFLLKPTYPPEASTLREVKD
ncbi:MAG: polysaccharide pyruvyl transferase family protein, partial [candidate division WOR-3 bacterium]